MRSAGRLSAGQDYYAALVYAVGGYHVKDVMVNGKWLYRDNRYLTVDYTQAKKDLEAKHTELMDRIKNKGKA